MENFDTLYLAPAGNRVLHALPHLAGPMIDVFAAAGAFVGLTRYVRRSRHLARRFSYNQELFSRASCITLDKDARWHDEFLVELASLEAEACK